MTENLVCVARGCEKPKDPSGTAWCTEHDQVLADGVSDTTVSEKDQPQYGVRFVRNNRTSTFWFYTSGGRQYWIEGASPSTRILGLVDPAQR